MSRWVKIILLWLTFAAASRAEEVVELVNGDRISGEVIKVESGTVYLRSQLLGEIHVPVSAVKSGLDEVKAAPISQVEKKGEPVVVVVLPAPVEEKKPEFSLRKVLHLPEEVTGDVKLSAYRRENGFLENGVHISPSLAWNGEKHSWEWYFSYRYRQDNNSEGKQWVTRDDRMTAEQKYRYNFDKTVFAQSRTYWEKDRVRAIDPRFIQSAGLGLYVLNNETLKLDLSPGVGYEYVDNSDTARSSVTPTFEQNFQWVINAHFSYKERFTWLGMQDEYQYNFGNELEVRLNNHLSVVLEHRLDYDQQVREDGIIHSRDERTSAAVRLSF